MSKEPMFTEEETMSIVRGLMIGVKVLDDMLNSELDLEAKELMEKDMKILDSVLSKVLPDYKNIIEVNV